MPDTLHTAVNRVPTRVIAMAFVPVFALLAAGYYVFLRPDFVPTFAGLRAQQAVAIAKELSGKSIAYRLESDGSAIAVPRDKVEEARLAIAGSDFGPGTSTGFELFNKSDMGLTDFAQKINYQRALQGELERTILGIDGIETARVHLALPEKSLFRAARSATKAAVEIGTKSDTALDAERVTSLQYLVASAVPELDAKDVTVVDESGRMLSTNAGSGPEADEAPVTEERLALQHLIRARLRGAIHEKFPDLQFDVNVNAVSAFPSESRTEASSEIRPRHNFYVRAAIITPYPLQRDHQLSIEGIARSTIGFNTASGDSLTFEAGPTIPVLVHQSAARADAHMPNQMQLAVPAAPVLDWIAYLVGGVLCVMAVVVLLVATRRRIARKHLQAAYHAELAARFREAIDIREDALHGN